jgi:tRNA A-37 threonylcarbamoyl transferase component Bud32/tetratricopeptide (TPR) repeat protein
VTPDERLEQAIGDWLVQKENEPALLPGEFARTLPADLRAVFLRELELLAEIDGLTTMAPSRDLPRRYGDFRVLGELGRGAMGAVYDAEQVSTGRRVALKVLHPHIAGEPAAAQRFRREARTASALVHPGIVPVLDCGETDGTAWLAMARIEGRSLQRLLAAAEDPRDVDHARAKALLAEPVQLAGALAEIADALAFAHEHGVVHRDIKPANLMRGDDGSMVVLDFGLATAREADAPSLTRTGDLLGTPLYMAPEQAHGAENGTPRSDVYALGAVLYECLCGVPPVAPGPLAAVLDAILNRPAVDPRRRRPGVPAELARIALQCLEKDPRDRYASAAALAADLRRFAAGEAVHARGSGWLQRSARAVRRRPARAVWPLVVGLSLLSALLVWGLAARRGAQVVTLQGRLDLQRIDELLASSPERLTVFGGASQRFYVRLGLGEALGSDLERSPGAAEALRLAAALVDAFPDDVEVRRAQARARLDVGDDLAAADAAIAALLALPDATAGDRMMAAVWARRQGRADEARRLAAEVGDAAAPDVAFWRGFWHQDEQDHEAAIAAFTRALAGVGSQAGALDAERRYFALLHRGWCRSCPDIAQLRAAQDDLLQAAALRPRYGTARLLWAALRCLEARTAADLGEPVAAVQEVLAGAAPWVHVLTARVLLALAEGGALQHGPVAFGAEFSPIGVLPVRAEFAPAFAGVALGLLDGLLRAEPDSFAAGFHRAAALALLDRHGEALSGLQQLQAKASAAQLPALELQRARVQLASGLPQRALTSVQRARSLQPRYVAAWRFEALVAAHLGERSVQLQALEQALATIAAVGRDPSVLPDAAAWWPELQLERAAALRSVGRDREAIELLRHGDFGGALAGADSPRVRQQRRWALQAVEASTELAAPVALAADSPLRWLASAAAPPTTVDADARSALLRGWLPASALAGAFAVEPMLQPVLQLRGALVPADLESAPLQAVFANLPALLAREGGAEALDRVAGRLLDAEPEHGEARLLRALVWQHTRRSAESAAYLAGTLAAHPDDLRSRYLLAVAARALGDRELLRAALRRERTPLSAPELDAVSAALPLAERVPAVELFAAAR